MFTLLSPGPHPLLLHPFPTRTRTLQPLPLFHRTRFSTPPNFKSFLRGSLTIANLGFFNSGHLPDPDSFEALISGFFARAEGYLYTIADAAVSNSDNVSATAATTAKENSDWLSGITYYMETVLKVLKDGLSTLHVPNSYGFAIILLTVIVKAATFPLTKKQVESSMAMRSMQPQIKAIQQRYAGDQERIQLEIARLYKLAGINPLAGCLPTLATIPVWIGLYRALSNVANEGLLTEGFFWIPSLAGPTAIASRQSGAGISWLFPFVDERPPLGWSDTFAYLVLPALLIISQYLSIQIIQSSQPNDPSLKSSQAITNFLPLMIGYFALSVPSGLSLYWLTNNILSTCQQVWLQNLGGAKNPLELMRKDILEEDRPQISQKQKQSSITEVEPTITVEKQTSTSLRPGERFKQIKEEEDRRRHEREEAKRKAEEAAEAVQIAEGANEEAKAVEAANSSRVGLTEEVNGKDQQASVASSSLDDELGVNGDVTAMTSKKKAVPSKTFGSEFDDVTEF